MLLTLACRRSWLCLSAITVTEVKDGLSRLHNGRSQGPLGQPAELLRYAAVTPRSGEPPPPHALAPVLAAVLTAMMRSGTVPDRLNGSLETPVFKKGSQLDTANYRPIAVTEPIMRLYAGILNRRLLAFTEGQGFRAASQAGFRPGLSVLHQIFALQHLIDRQQHDRSQLFVCMWDLKGAYDRVSRPLLWQVLQRLGVTGAMLGAVQSLYSNASVSVRVAGRHGPALPSRTGVKQGCPLSPTLFGLFADGLHAFLQGVASSSGVPVGPSLVVTDLGYADDFVLTSPSQAGLQLLIDAAELWCTAVGMQPSPGKILCSELTAADTPAFECMCAGSPLECVQEVRYLGAFFAPGAGMRPTCAKLRPRMWGAWATLQCQYGNLGCS